jgi:hypothetical protein
MMLSLACPTLCQAVASAKAGSLSEVGNPDLKGGGE